MGDRRTSSVSAASCSDRYIGRAQAARRRLGRHSDAERYLGGDRSADSEWKARGFQWSETARIGVKIGVKTPKRPLLYGTAVRNVNLILR